MATFVDISEDLVDVQQHVLEAIERVCVRFDEQLRSDLPPVQTLCKHVERYRGKLLRPTLVMLSGLAAQGATSEDLPEIGDDLIKLGAVVEMVHMATLVHDDILDEAETRRRGETVNAKWGNESAVILGDYLIASAFHLCSQLQRQDASLLIGQVAREMCAGELLQLSNRDNLSLDDATYREILDGKTAALIGASCRLGAMGVDAPAELCDSLDTFGRRVGVAFQIQDDVLDLTGKEQTVGKSVGRDLAKGKLTLPIMHHLQSVEPGERGTSIDMLERAAGSRVMTPDGPADTSDAELARQIVARIEATGSIDFAKREAERLVREGQDALKVLKDTPTRRFMLTMADAVVDRSF